MNKIDKYILDNGLNVILYSDKTKHSVNTNLFVKFGGSNKKIIINNLEYKIKDGTAHFMEHLLYEHSIYGDSSISFSENYTNSNAFTNNLHTCFYIDSVVNYKDDLVKLINIVNNPSFTEENVEEVRAAIVKEKMMSKDQKFIKLNKMDYECLFENINYPNILGEVEDINSITYDEIKRCYEAFYNPNNQILFIAGNFDIEETKKIIEETYNSFKTKYIKYELPNINEKKEITKLEGTVYEDIHMDYVRINYKIYIDDLSPYNKVKLTFYFHYFLSYLFGSDSSLYSELVKDNICTYDIDRNYSIVDKFLILNIGTFTNKKDIFIKKIKEAICNKNLDEDKFNLYKKDTIIKIILREDNLYSLMNPLIDNILMYNYYEFDKVDDIMKYTFTDYKEMINSLDFSNYCVTTMIKK